MRNERISVGVGIPPRPPAGLVDAAIAGAQEAGVDTMWCIDHFGSFVPQSIWDSDFSPFATPGTSPDEIFEFQTLLGYVSARTAGIRLGVGVTEAIRRHPAILAQAFLTLSHLNDEPVILGIGAGERENTDPFGFDFRGQISRLEEALQIIHMCFTSRGPFDFSGRFFQLEGAILDLEPGPAGPPEIWVAAQGPRALELAGRYGDGWYPTVLMDPASYAGRLASVHDSATKAGRDPEAIRAALQTFIVVDVDRTAARALLDSPAVRLMALLLPSTEWAAAGRAHPMGDGFRGVVDFIPQHYNRATMQGALQNIRLAFVQIKGQTAE